MTNYERYEKPEHLDALGQIKFEIVKARAKAAHTHRCSCGSKKEPKVVDLGFRSYESCERCLGVIRHLS